MVAQKLKNPPAMQEIRVPSPGWEEPIGEGNDYSVQNSCLGNMMGRGTWQAPVHGLQRAWHDWAANTSTFALPDTAKGASYVVHQRLPRSLEIMQGLVFPQHSPLPTYTKVSLYPGLQLEFCHCLKQLQKSWSPNFCSLILTFYPFTSLNPSLLLHFSLPSWKPEISYSVFS